MLTEREQKFLDCVEWLRNATHEAHHMVTTDAAGNRIKVPDEHRRRADECGSMICQYSTKIITMAKESND